MHPCGHSSIKFLWSCDTRAQDLFSSIFKSTQYFQNMFIYQFVHSSESILGVRENFHSIHPSGVYTFFQKLVMISKIFQRKVGNYLFSQACCFLARQPLLFFIFYYLFIFSPFLFFSCLLSLLFFFHEVFCYLNIRIFL